MKRSTGIQNLIIFAMVFFVSSAQGEGGGVEYSGSGFLTVAVGKMLGGTRANVEDYNCPCFISDYAQAGVYDGRSSLQWKPDSKLGVQGSASYNSVSVTAQVVARGATGTADLEWLYGNYNLNDKVSIQAGRKRLPMFYYSDVQDIGIVLPWTHLPPGPYGWEAVNYNGVNVRYQDRWGSWSATGNLLAGDESNNNSGYWKIYNGRQSQSSIKWSNIVGGDLTLSRDWLETRVVYIQSDTQESLVSSGWDGQAYTLPPGVLYPPAKQQIVGLTVNADYRDWLLRSEFIQINHPGLTYRDHAQLVGIGYRYGKWQPMVTWSEYQGTVVTDGVLPNAAPSFPNMQQTISLTLRYDLTTSSDLKVQFDSESDHSSPGYQALGYDYGNARLLTFTYDTAF
jgi:hypothetical protein